MYSVGRSESVPLLRRATYTLRFRDRVKGFDISILLLLYKSAIRTLDVIGPDCWTSNPLSIDDFQYPSIRFQLDLAIE